MCFYVLPPISSVLEFIHAFCEAAMLLTVSLTHSLFTADMWNFEVQQQKVSTSECSR